MTMLPKTPPLEFTPDEAARIRAHIRARGIAFETFLPESLADWLRGQVEAGHYEDVREAAFVAFELLKSLTEHPQVRAQLFKAELARRMDAHARAPGSGITIEEFMKAHHEKLEQYLHTPPPPDRALPTPRRTRD